MIDTEIEPSRHDDAKTNTPDTRFATLHAQPAASEPEPPAQLAASSPLGREYRIGIVGCGPRGLYCLQSLADELQKCESLPSLAIVIFEPSDFPGAGNVYDPRQPRFLKMNFAAKHIDAWPRDEERCRERLNLVDWLNHDGGCNADPNSFVCRAAVGQYLHQCYQHVTEQLEQIASVSVLQEEVTSIGRLTDAWQVRTDRTLFNFDELVLTVGHGRWPEPPEKCVCETSAFIPTFPVSENLTQERIPSGCDVAIRGFGLTWIDATLALTEGREGEFHQSVQDWTYQPSGHEPACVYPLSRTGRPMLAKPHESLFNQPAELDDIWASGRKEIEAIARPITPQILSHTLWPIITGTAASAIKCCTDSSDTTAESVQAWFDHWCGTTMSADESLRAMKRSYAVATGHAKPDIAWALGAAWRNLYPALVQSVSYGGLAADAWPKFRNIASEMERIAFGPPAENVGKMLALIEQGIANLQFISGSIERKTSGSEEQLFLKNAMKTHTVDRCIDAVLRSPKECTTLGPFQSLVDEKAVEHLPGAETLHIDNEGRPGKRIGNTPDGIAIIGRATEGCVLGNDTLSRTLHDHPQRWAASVVKRIQNAEILT